jgi:hypothetical protein
MSEENAMTQPHAAELVIGLTGAGQPRTARLSIARGAGPASNAACHEISARPPDQPDRRLRGLRLALRNGNRSVRQFEAVEFKDVALDPAGP